MAQLAEYRRKRDPEATAEPFGSRRGSRGKGPIFVVQRHDARRLHADGMHILVPIERRHTYDETRRFAEVVAGAIARSHPGLATTEWSKAKRRGVLIDANQNGEGMTIASVYSVRPRPGAPVSTPLRWDEVNETLNPSIYTMDVVLDRIDQHGDLIEGVLTTKQRLGRALRALQH